MAFYLKIICQKQKKNSKDVTYNVKSSWLKQNIFKKSSKTVSKSNNEKENIFQNTIENNQFGNQHKT